MTIVPKLLHPVDIKIQAFAPTQPTDNTFYDDDFREPVQQAVRPDAYIINAQMSWSSDKSISITRGGKVLNSSGYALIRRIDMNAISVDYINEDDRIIEISGVKTDLYIIRVVPWAHYGGFPTIYKCYFEDRQPSRQGNGF